MVEMLEVTMLIAFGISWPMNILKSIKSRTAKGKSLIFLILIAIGYVAGTLSKIVGNNITFVIGFYILNFVMVTFDIILYFINSKRDRKSNNGN